MNSNRRDFLKTAGFLVTGSMLSGCQEGMVLSESEKPNILWITCEDLSCWIGCYGDGQADTGNIDKLASKGTMYTNAYASAPVCAPARSCLITGVYATSLGTQHLRSSIKIPEKIRCFTEYMRNSGYYCTNNVKKDYNFKDVNAWDESSVNAHWRNRPAGKPFFSVFNIMTTHQSRLNGSDAEWYLKFGKQIQPGKRHRPEDMKIPPFYPDTPEIRKMWARYYNLTTIMDRQVGDILKQLEDDGLAEDTIVFFYSDHGSGIARHKRDLHDSGLKVPFVLRVPEKYKHLAPTQAGQQTDRLVSFVDFAPTALSVANIKIPDYIQGRAFLGKQKSKPRDYVYAHASRVDEAYDMSRAVRDKQYKYIRNYLPHIPWIQPSAYPDKSEINHELYRTLEAVDLTRVQRLMWEKRPAEELYDTKSDPHEVNNLAAKSQYKPILEKMRNKLHQWMLDIKDTGLLCEAEMHLRSEQATPYDMTRSKAFDAKKILTAAETVGKSEPADVLPLLTDSDSAVRFWVLIAIKQQSLTEGTIGQVRELMSDPNPNVRYTAAGIIAGYDDSLQALDVLVKGLDDSLDMAVLYAARELQMLGDKIKPVVNDVSIARDKNYKSNRANDYKTFTDWSLTYCLRNCGIKTDYYIKF